MSRADFRKLLTSHGLDAASFVRQGAGARQSGRSPTDADWVAAIELFENTREIEDPVFLEKLRKFARVLEREASTVYDVADAFDRRYTYGSRAPDPIPGGGKLEAHAAEELARHSPEALVARLRRQGYTARHVRLSGQLPDEMDTSSPKSLRLYATQLHWASERVDSVITAHQVAVTRLRTARSGRNPDLAMHQLIQTTDGWGAVLSEIARKLVDNGVFPKNEGDDDPVAQWVVILKKARLRVRRRSGALKTKR